MNRKYAPMVITMEEISAYDRILNVHVKDRKYMGSTVPLGSGDAHYSQHWKNFCFMVIRVIYFADSSLL